MATNCARVYHKVAVAESTEKYSGHTSKGEVSLPHESEEAVRPVVRLDSSVGRCISWVQWNDGLGAEHRRESRSAIQRRRGSSVGGRFQKGRCSLSAASFDLYRS